MDDLKARMERVRADLAAIQQQLNWAAVKSSREGDLGSAMVDLEAVKEFKGCIDDMRHFLWSYVDGLMLRSGKDMDFALQTFRMQRATEMLRTVRDQMNDNSILALEAHNFFQEVQNIASVVMDRHMPAGTAGTGAKQKPSD